MNMNARSLVSCLTTTMSGTQLAAEMQALSVRLYNSYTTH